MATNIRGSTGVDSRFGGSNPAYQIDVLTASTGKTFANTKRRVRFRFGFSNKDALAAGQTGTDCRGEEHEIILIWSLTSGKRLVLADGKEVHYSMGKVTSGKFQTSWTMRGNHVIKLVAYAAAPMKSRPNFKQYEIFLDGMSFFDMPKVYELGGVSDGAHARGMVSHGGAAAGQTYSNYSMPPAGEDPAAFARPSAEQYYEPAGTDFLAAESALFDTYAAPPSNPASAGASLDTFAPQAPTYEDVASNVLGQYGTAPQPPPQQFAALPPSTSAPPQQQHLQQHQQQYYAPSPPQQQQYYAPSPPQQQQAPQYYEQPPQQQAAPQYSTPQKGAPENNSYDNVIAMKVFGEGSPAGVAEIEAEVDEVSRAMKSLVNFDDINEEPVRPLTMMDREKEREQAKAAKSKGASVGAKGTSEGRGMEGRSLAEVKDLHGGGVRRPLTKEVMRATAFDPQAAQAGMMVLYGAPGQLQPLQQPAYGGYGVQQPVQQQHDYSQGPPPLGNGVGTGFGIGATMQGGGYAATQQRTY
jgi:hypothetical protein